MKKIFLPLFAAALLFVLTSCGKKNTLNSGPDGVCLVWEGNKTCLELSASIQSLTLQEGKPVLTALGLDTDSMKIQFPQYEAQLKLTKEPVTVEQKNDSLFLIQSGKKIGTKAKQGFLIWNDGSGQAIVMQFVSKPIPEEQITITRGNIYLNGKGMGRLAVARSRYLKGGYIITDFTGYPNFVPPDSSHRDDLPMLFSNAIENSDSTNNTGGTMLINLDSFVSETSLTECCLEKQQIVVPFPPPDYDSLDDLELINVLFRDILCVIKTGHKYTIRNCQKNSQQEVNTINGDIYYYIDDDFEFVVVFQGPPPVLPGDDQTQE